MAVPESLALVVCVPPVTPLIAEWSVSFDAVELEYG